ncbi:acyltransferase family protein [Sabulibacter ruber]|uniref:acyltransferase family protein n=1 Tax=Sabulibacter ruber TaxID=2811901 RepID=UPI001A962437|nr:acyltransferase [Sabulibacter ruber]
MENLIKTRRYEFDWLRVLAFSLLIFYHTGMFFVAWEWHLKNNQLSEALELPMQFMSQWRMSLIFLVSGVGVYYALGYRPAGTFTKDRLKRILLPLVIGMLVVVPPQVYFERLTQGFQGNYFQFFPSIFEFEPYPEGNFSWHHLWYLAYVLCYSLLLLPVLLYLRKTQIQETAGKLWLLLVAPALWLSVGAVLLNNRFPATNALLDDWANHFLYITMFLFGFLLMKLPQLQQKIKEVRFGNLVLAVSAFSLLLFFMHDREFEDLSQTQQAMYFVLKSCNRWFWLMTILGFAMTHLSFKGKYLAQANEMVYPFYILHQTVIVALAFYLRDLDWAIFPKFALISGGTFAICFLLVRYVIMPVNWLRVPFGLAPRKPAVPAMSPVAVEQKESGKAVVGAGF